MKYLKDYQYRTRFQNFEHVYRIRGQEGAVFLWWVDPENGKELYGGLEIASLKPMYGAGGYPITSWAVDGQRCWVDGTSTYAIDELIPRAKAMQPNHKAVFDMLLEEYQRRFNIENQ